MKSSDSLFLLIKSMTRAEKRSFRINMSKFQPYGNSLCPLLFDAIDAQKEYDERAIKKKLQKAAPSFTQLAPVKSYLHKQILKSLRNFYDDASHNIKLSNYLVEIEILYKKELFRDCKNSIAKAKACAEKYEKLPMLLRILEWEIRVADHSNDIKLMNTLKQKAIKETKAIVSKYGELTELRQMYLESRTHFHAEGEARTKEQRKAHSDIIKHPLMNRKAQSFLGEHLRYTAKVHHAQLERNPKGICMNIEKVLELYDTHPQHIDENINVYFNNMVELTVGYMLAGKFIAAQQVVQKMKAIGQKKQQDLYTINKVKLLQLETDLAVNRGEFAEALSLVQATGNMLETEYKELDPTEEQVMNQLYFIVYFVNKDFKKAQHYIHQIINSDPSIRIDMHTSARISNLILQYEQQEYEHLAYVIRSTYRYLAKKERLYEPESIMLDFLTKATKITSEKQVIPALAEFKKKYLPYVNEPVVVFPLIEWIDSKVEKRELAEVMKESYAKLIAAEERS